MMKAKAVSKGCAVLVLAITLWAVNGFAKESNPIQGEFAPKEVFSPVGAFVSLTLEFASKIAFPNGATLELILPEGISLVSGKPKITIAVIVPRKKSSFHYKFKVMTAGEKSLKAKFKANIPSGTETYGRTFIATINPVLHEKRSVERTMPDGTKVNVTTVPENK